MNFLMSFAFFLFVQNNDWVDYEVHYIISIKKKPKKMLQKMLKKLINWLIVKFFNRVIFKIDTITNYEQHAGCEWSDCKVFFNK